METTFSKNLLNKNSSRRLRWWPTLVVIGVSMTVYWITLAPTVTGEDSGELITAAYGGGVAHPSGYPLWTMLAWLAIKMIPIGAMAYRVNLLSAILSSCSAGLLCRTLQRFFNQPVPAAIAGSLCFAWGCDLWSQSVIAEVYTLHILLCCLILHFSLAWLSNPIPGYLYRIAFLTGLGLANHHLTVLWGPLLVGLVLIRKPKIFVAPKVVVLCLLLLAVGLLPYIYLPLAAHHHPYMNWGSPDTWDNFERHVLRKQYSDDSMHSHRNLHQIIGHLGILWNWNVKQYTLLAVPLILVGAVHLFRYKRTLFFWTMAVFLMHSIGLSEILNFNFQKQELHCVQVFMLPVYIITAIWLTVGANELLHGLSSRFSQKYIAGGVEWTAFGIVAIIVLIANYRENNMRYYYYAKDHADNILKFLEPKALLISSGDHNTFPVIYRHYVENVRPDIVIGDKYGYIEYELYRSMPDAPKRVRTFQQRREIEAYLIQHSGRPVYYTVKPQLDLLPGYRAVSYGMLFRVFAPGESIPSEPDTLPRYFYQNLAESKGPMDYSAKVILSDYYFNLASNNLHMKKIPQAMEYIEKAASLSEGLKEEMNNLGTLLAEFGLNQQAIRFYEQSAKLDPDYLTPRWNLAYLFKSQGDIVRAIQVFNDMANKQPKDYRIFGELGFLLDKHGNQDLALKNWGTSLNLNPNQPQIIEAISKYSKTVSPDSLEIHQEQSK